MATVRVQIDLPLEPATAFDVIIEEMVFALRGAGIEIEAAPSGRVREEGHEIGQVTAWNPGERLMIVWRPAHWNPGERTEIEMRFDVTGVGTQVTLEHR